MGRILVVDDNDMLRDLAARLLRRGGHEVREAVDGPAALAMMAGWGTDLVLLDVFMPGMDGIEVMERLRCDPALAGIAVVVVSASDDPKIVTRAIELGARQYLVKSRYSVQELMDTVARHLPAGKDRFRHVVFPAEGRVLFRSELMRMKLAELEARIGAKQAAVLARLEALRSKAPAEASGLLNPVPTPAPGSPTASG